MSDARTVIAKWLGDETHVASGGTSITTATPDTRRADAILAALALAGFVITTRERWDALVRVAEGIERVVVSKDLEGSE